MTINLENLPRTIWVEKSGGAPVVGLVDQRRLPGDLVFVRTSDWREVVDAVKTLAVRGAPAIGVAGAAAVMLAAFEYESRDDFDERLEEAARAIAEARPTAVNLSWGVRRAMETAQEARNAGEAAAQTSEALYTLAEDLIAEDEAVNRRIGAHGAQLLRELAGKRGKANGRRAMPQQRDERSSCPTHDRGAALNILTHCNAGSLATAFFGTALGVVYASAQEGLINRVYADETRPVNQGARLTVWELARAGVPVTLQCDDMAASLMMEGQVDAVIVGADRIAANGDVANKIGTLGLAIMARHLEIPFYVAAPKSTTDCTTKTGSDIPIEERDSSEVLAEPIPGVAVRNPAFDVTPYELISAIITEDGVWQPVGQ